MAYIHLPVLVWFMKAQKMKYTIAIKTKLTGRYCDFSNPNQVRSILPWPTYLTSSVKPLMGDPPDIRFPAPLNIYKVPNVIMKGWGILSRVIPRPLIKPHKSPANIGASTTTNQGAPALETIAKIINDSIIIDPTDKSIPAVTITIKTPRANIDCQDICLKTFVTLRHDKKTSGCKICITTIIKTSKSKIPYLSK